VTKPNIGGGIANAKFLEMPAGVRFRAGKGSRAVRDDDDDDDDDHDMQQEVLVG